MHSNLPRATVSALRAADNIFAVSEWTRQRVLAIGQIEDAKVVVIPNTFDASRFSVGRVPHDLRKRYALRESDKVILTVARLDTGERYKGYDKVMMALPAVIAECGSVRFIVVGTGDDQPRIAALANTLGVADAVTFAGFVARTELADHYRLADAFVMPSTGEGFGIVFLEAMACGTPVIAGNKDGSVDALDKGRLGKLVDPDSIESIAGGIISILNGIGPPLWFEKEDLHNAVVSQFGRTAFGEKIRLALPACAE